MSDKMRWRYGDTNPVMADADSDTVIEIGDMVWLDSDDVKPLDRVEEHCNKFLGVAMQRSRAGDENQIRIATSGVFEFDCASSTFELGEVVGPVNKQCVGRSEFKIGRVAKREPQPQLSVLVDIHSAIMRK